MDLFTYKAAPPPPHNQSNALSVTQLSNLLRKNVESTFGKIAVEGEISGYKQAASGHIYFNLKDEQSLLKAVMWRSTAVNLTLTPEDGMQVILHGKLTTYGARSEYQVVVDRIETAGVGTLLQTLEERKKALTAEGLFDEARKKDIPFLPQTIGIVTSPTGAVIKDMLHRISDRFPGHVILWPVMVQGNGAREQISDAINGFNRLPVRGKVSRPDVLIVARGGGSLEDLWAFNEEIVVRAIADSDIPVISGVGHEPDVTLADYAADLRAPTPSAAAELAVPVRGDLVYTITTKQNRLNQHIVNQLRYLKERATGLQKTLPRPESQLNQARIRLDDRHARLNQAMAHAMQATKLHIKATHKLLKSYAPDAPLKRGYTYVTGHEGSFIRSAKTTESAITLHFHDGTRQATLEK